MVGSLTKAIRREDDVSLGTCGVGLEGEVHVAAGARLVASVFARRVVIEGEFQGRVTAQVVEFGATAAATGTFDADAIVMREGAFVDGAFNVSQQAEPEVAAALEPQPVSDDDLARLAEAEPVTAAVN